MTARVVGPEPAECPDDGGKWALYHEHLDAEGDVVAVSIIQDTNKRRLAAWRNVPGEWCCYCQEV